MSCPVTSVPQPHVGSVASASSILGHCRVELVYSLHLPVCLSSILLLTGDHPGERWSGTGLALSLSLSFHCFLSVFVPLIPPRFFVTLSFSLERDVLKPNKLYWHTRWCYVKPHVNSQITQFPREEKVGEVSTHISKTVQQQTGDSRTFIIFFFLLFSSGNRSLPKCFPSFVWWGISGHMIPGSCKNCSLNLV